MQTEQSQPADWHWIEAEENDTAFNEIEGEATVVLPDQSTSLTAAAVAPMQLPAERSDDTVIASLAERQLTIHPGGSGILRVTLLNNGNRAARFRLQTESELKAEWIDPLDQSILLQPGESSVLEITIHPPRSSAARAGEYPLSIHVAAAEYPGRYSELHGAVTITAFRDLAVGTVQLQSPTVNAFRRSVRLSVPLSNLGNAPTTVQLSGYEQGRRYLYRFATDVEHAGQQPTLHLEPGQSLFVHALVRPVQRAWVGAQPRQLRPALLFQISEEVRAPRAAVFSLYDLPFFGIWTLAGLAAAAMLMMIGLIAAGVIAAGIWWMRQMPMQAQPMIQQVSAAPQPAQPVVVVVPVNSVPIANPQNSAQPVANPPAAIAPVSNPADANQVSANPVSANPVIVNPPAAQPAPEVALLPTPTAEPERNSATFTRQGVVALTSPLTADAIANGNVPIITAADISQPAPQSAPALAVPTPVVVQAQPVVSQPNPASSEQRMTYAQMFQEIALRYDLNWRMLAAQAYIESGFDSLALGKSGDMGLMQILPKTWQEFAPKVNVKDPFESYSNTLVAATYLDYLRTKLSEKGFPQQEWALVAYNWGPDHVLDFLASGGTWETLDPERRKYAEEILRITVTIP